MNNRPKMIIAGGSGFFGNHLINYFNEKYALVVLTRGKSATKNNVKYVNWDAKHKNDWIKEIDDAEVLINLSGKSINCRFTENNKKALMTSRLDSTRILGKAVKELKNPPKLWLNASAGAMYSLGSIPNSEKDEPKNTNFLADMAIRWEDEFFKVDLKNTRRVAMRISLLFGADGGVFPVWRKITKLGLGGRVASGKQMVSWIHVNDALKAVNFLINSEISGPVNFSTAHPVSNSELMKTMRKNFKVPIGICSPAFIIKIMAPIVGSEPSLLLESVNFVPSRLLDEGFNFEFSRLDQAINDLK